MLACLKLNAGQSRAPIPELGSNVGAKRAWLKRMIPRVKPEGMLSENRSTLFRIMR
jgi:hypothetical protein